MGRDIEARQIYGEFTMKSRLEGRLIAGQMGYILTQRHNCENRYTQAFRTIKTPLPMKIHHSQSLKSYFSYIFPHTSVISTQQIPYL